MIDNQVLARLNTLELKAEHTRDSIMQAIQAVADNLRRLEVRMVGESGTNGEISKLYGRIDRERVEVQALITERAKSAWTVVNALSACVAAGAALYVILQNLKR